MIDGILRFFLNALKAILLSPFYLAFFAIYLVVNVFVFIFGTLKTIFTGFKYGTKKENKYEKKLREVARSYNNSQAAAMKAAQGGVHHA